MNIIDPHFHFWDLENLSYPWLMNPSAEGLLGDYRSICRNYLLEDYLEDIKGQNVVKAVHIESAAQPEDSLAETQWLKATAERSDSGGFPHGIVFFADLSAPDVEMLLDHHCHFANVRGVRQMLNRHKNASWNFAPQDYLSMDSWQANFALLKKYDFSFDLQIFYQQMDVAHALAQRYPEIQIILNHSGMPAERDADGIKKWQKGMEMLAQCPNIAVKISGLAMVDHQWTVDSIRPFVLDTIKFFGPDRCMFASNFPVDKVRSSCKMLWDAYQTLIKDFSQDERRAMVHDNALRYYRL